MRTELPEHEKHEKHEKSPEKSPGLRALPLHIVISFLAVHLVAFDIIVRCALSDGHVGRFVTATAAAGMAFGATAAMCRRTWGVGLMLAAAASFFVAGALGMGPPFFFVVAMTGIVPFLLTMKYMARFHLGATILFALLAGAVGTTASLAWGAVAWDVIAWFGN